MSDKTPIPVNEEERIKTLQDYNVLDTLPEDEYDELTKLASYIAKMPIALISLVDKDRQWFKSKVGLDADQTPRNISFCQHAIMTDEVFDVPNALENPIFKDNPLVSGAPDIRRYHGFPLKAPNGSNIGTLCVIDMEPGELDAEQKHALETIAKQVITNLEIRKKNEYLETVNLQKNSFFNLSIDLICIANTEGFFEMVNPAFSNTLGYTESELLSSPFFNFICAEDQEKTLAEITRLSQGEKTVDFVAKFISKSGESKILSWRAAADPTTGKLYAVARDVTEQLEKEHLLTLELEAIDSSVLRVELSPTRKVIKANGNFLELSGYNSDELIGKDHSDLLFEVDTNYQNFWKNILDGKPQNGEFLRKSKSGDKFWIQGAYIPILTTNGTLEKVIKIAYETTETVQQKQNLLKLSSTQNAILNGTDYSIISTDTEGIVTMFNSGAENLLGYKAEEIVNKTSPAIFHDLNEVVAKAGDLSEEFNKEIAPGFDVFVYKARETGQTDENEWTYVNKGGKRIPVMLSITTLKDNENNIFGYLGIAKDITQEKSFLRKIQKQNEQLDQFAYVVSHDLKAPLRAINTLSEFIEEDLEGKMDEDVQNNFNLLRKRTATMQHLIADILEYSKIGKTNIKPEVFETKVLLDEIISNLASPDGFKFEIDPKLPKVNVQKIFINQVFGNLVSNAIKYNDKEQGMLEVDSMEDDGKGTFVLEDN